MTVHRFRNATDRLIEEPCNAYCDGDRHATVVYTDAEPDGEALRSWVERAFAVRNPWVAVELVAPAPEAPPCPPDRYLPGVPPTAAFLVRCISRVAFR